MDPLQTSNPGEGLPENKQQPDFQKKPVEQPILDNALRNKIITDSKPGPAGWKGFYRANKIYVWAIAIGLVIIAVLAFFAFRKPAPKAPGEANVQVSIEAPEAVASGGEEVYKIKLQNNDREKLVGMQLELAYPDGVTYVSSVPKAENISGSIFKVPDLISGQNAVVMVKTKVTGNINDEKKIVAKLHYKYSNFSSDFTKEQQFSVRLVASDVTLDITGPQSANNAQLIVYTIHYKNNSQDDIKNARIQAAYPDGFSYAQSQPLPDMGNNVWNVGTVPAGKDGSLTVQGTFRSANPGENKMMGADLLVLGQDGKYYTQYSATPFVTAMSSLPLLVSQELQNGNAENVIKPGDRLVFNIKYQNNASTVATGVNVVVTLDSKSLDLSSLQTEGGQINNNTITWNGSAVPNLNNLNPSDSGQLSFTVNVKDPATRDSSKSLSVVSDIKIKSNEYDTYLPGNQLSLKIASPVTLSSRLDYVSGSLPPQVGKQTVYKVRISLNNSTNDYSNGMLTVSIPSSGYVDGSVNVAEAGKTSYDTSTGKLTWNFGNLPAHTGAFSQARTLEFSVKISPSPSQANQSPVLVKDIQFQARDMFTNQTVSESLDNISTSDLSGNQGWSNGQVQP